MGHPPNLRCNLRYFVLQPEVAGGTGPKTVFIDRCARPPVMSHFNYQFDGWLGDPILETIGNIIVTEPIKDRLTRLKASGASFAAVEVSKSSEFEDLYPGRELPPFVWLQVYGHAGQDDFSYTSDHVLMVSERILDVLRESGMSNCTIVGLEDWKGLQAAMLEKIQRFRIANPLLREGDGRGN